MELQKGNQIAAGRALLGWDQKDLAERVGVTTAAISKIEKGDNKGKATTIAKIQAAFEGAGVEFTSSGVRLKRNAVRVLEGIGGFLAFFDDVYWTLRKDKTKPVCISNVAEDEFEILPREFFKMHMKRITDLKLPQKYKVLTKYGDLYFPASSYAEYRWAPEGTFLSIPHYIYGDKLATIVFKGGLRIYIMNEKEVTDMYRIQFEAMWKQARQPVGKARTTQNWLTKNED